MAYETIQSEQIYQGRVFNIRRDRVRLPNGEEARYDVVEHNDAVTILPLDEQGQVWFVRQYRHAAGEDVLELPAGLVEDGEPVEKCARREIQEEIGMAARKIQKIGEFYLAAGYSTEFMHVFLAQELYPEALEADDDEFLAVEQYPLEEVYRMAAAGQILDAKTLAALLLVKPFLEQAGKES
jgi:ADP-ribose pyrophosphatase